MYSSAESLESACRRNVSLPRFILIFILSSGLERRKASGEKCKFTMVCFSFDVEFELRKASADEMQEPRHCLDFDSRVIEKCLSSESKFVIMLGVKGDILLHKVL